MASFFVFVRFPLSSLDESVCNHFVQYRTDGSAKIIFVFACHFVIMEISKIWLLLDLAFFI